MNSAILRTLKRKAHLIFLVAANAGLLVYSLHGLQTVSLWHDEAWVALSVLKPSVWEMLTWNDSPQVTPSLFLILVRFATQLFGSDEAVLRSLPVLFGFVVLNLTWVGARAIHGRGYAPALAVLLHVSCLYALRYNKELKPYVAEMATALILLLYFGGFQKDSAETAGEGTTQYAGRSATTVGWKGAWKDLALAGAALLLSNSAFLVLFPLIALRALDAGRTGDRVLLVRLATVFVFSALFLTVYYFTYLARTAGGEFLHHFWKHGWPPKDPGGWPGFAVRQWRSFLLFVFLGAAKSGGWAVLAGLVGLVLARRWQFLLLVCAIPVEMFLLSFFRAYPFDAGSRLMLFYLPFVFIGISGILSERALKFARRVGRFVPATLVAVCALFLASNVRGQKKGIGYVYDYEPMKDYYELLVRDYNPQTDSVAVYQNSVFAFRFYNRKRALPFIRLERPVKDLVRTRRGRRLWVLVTRPLYVVDQKQHEDLIIEADIARLCGPPRRRHELQKGKIKNGSLFLFDCR